MAHHVRASLRLVLSLVIAGCGGGGGGGGGGGSTGGGGGGEGGADAGPPPVTGGFAQVETDARAIIAADPRLAVQKPLAPADYAALAAKLGGVRNVESAEYTGDAIGTVMIKLPDSGTLYYQHIANEYVDGAKALPPEADAAEQKHPVWNAGWRDPQPVLPLAPREPSAALATSNTFATAFPLPGIAPDPEFKADLAVPCLPEGKIALVDFLWTEAHLDTPGLYSSQYMVDGVMLYDRLKGMAEAAGFTFEVFKDQAINAGNYRKLQDYTVVMLHGHGGVSTRRKVAGANATAFIGTAELYNETALMDDGTTYLDAFKKGHILVDLRNNHIAWTPNLFRDAYKPSAAQLVILNSCNSLTPYWGGFVSAGSSWSWVNAVKGDPVYTFGDAMMASGVHAVMGYVSVSTPEAIVANEMPFFRRMFGAYSAKDKPPAPLNFWPTCMGARTFFRLASSPASKVYADKVLGDATFTMFAKDDTETFRANCPASIPHAALQDFMFRVGTPATAFQACWDKYWSTGDPVGLKDPLCNQGDKPTTEAATKAAACEVRTARQVSVSMLK